MDRRRLPDFIIGGAPKCATSTIHMLLAARDDIGIPEQELHFFDADDPVSHPEFLSVERGKLNSFDCDSDDGEFFLAYAAQFERFRDKRLIGEDSTTYLMSPVASDRILKRLPSVKLIFTLRDPVARAYSQYWHLVSSGRATVSFERALSKFPAIVLGSTYAQPLARYFDKFGREQVKVVLFEDLLSDKQGTIDSISDFLGLPRCAISEERAWRNKTRYPRSERLQFAVNAVRKPLIANRYRNHLRQADGRSPLIHAADRVLRRIGTSRLNLASGQPPMKEETRAYLARHLSARNEGLSQLLNRNLGDVWPGFTG